MDIIKISIQSKRLHTSQPFEKPNLRLEQAEAKRLSF